MCHAIVTDIEGTTSSIRFVKETLFPYAAAALPDFVRKHAETEQVRLIIAEAASIAGLSIDNLEAIISQCLTWIKTDQKITPLKTLQGLIWEAGYRRGAFRAHLYPDAFEALKKWHQSGIPLFVYSSGSIKAQRLFFEHSVFGDLRYLFTDYFDTTIGPKREADSYRNIASAIGFSPSEVLFLSDVSEELSAALTAGFQTRWVVRDAGRAESETDFKKPWARVVRSFEEIVLFAA